MIESLQDDITVLLVKIAVESQAQEFELGLWVVNQAGAYPRRPCFTSENYLTHQNMKETDYTKITMYSEPFEALRLLQQFACLRNFVPGANCEECIFKAVKRDN